MNEFLASDIKFLKGVGSTRAEVLQKELGIFCFADLINYYPFRYVDRSKFYKISEIETDTSYIQLKGRIKGKVFTLPSSNIVARQQERQFTELGFATMKTCISDLYDMTLSLSTIPKQLGPLTGTRHIYRTYNIENC